MSGPDALLNAVQQFTAAKSEQEHAEAAVQALRDRLRSAEEHQVTTHRAFVAARDHLLDVAGGGVDITLVVAGQ